MLKEKKLNVNKIKSGQVCNAFRVCVNNEQITNFHEAFIESVSTTGKFSVIINHQIHLLS